MAETHKVRVSAIESCGVSPGSDRFSPMVPQEESACDVGGTHGGKRQNRKLQGICHQVPRGFHWYCPGKTMPVTWVEPIEADVGTRSRKTR